MLVGLSVGRHVTEMFRVLTFQELGKIIINQAASGDYILGGVHLCLHLKCDIRMADICHGQGPLHLVWPSSS